MLTAGQGITAVSGVLITAFLLYPAPQLSPKLAAWKLRGKLFMYKDVQIFYIDEDGSGDAGTVICLHGFPSLSLDWIKMLPSLKKQFSRIILLDFIGMGFSDKPSDYNYSIFDQADLVESLADHQKVTNAHLLSHDYGDTVALELVARFKERYERSEPGIMLSSLCLLNGGLFPGKYYPRLIQRILLTPILGEIAARMMIAPLFKRGFGEIFGTNKPTAEEFDDFYAAIRYDDGNIVLPGLLQYIKERTANEDRWVGTLKSSPIQVMMIYGPADPVNPPPFQDHFRNVAPQHEIVVLDVSIGHYPQWEDPNKTSSNYLRFIQNLPKK